MMDLAEVKAFTEQHKGSRTDMWHWMIAEIEKLTALCDEYRGEVERLKASDEDVFCTMRFNKTTGDFEVVEPPDDTTSFQSALTRARADYEEFKKAKAHISGDRLGSYTLYGQWTLTADLTTEEVENHHYRTALERGRADGMEETAKIVHDAMVDDSVEWSVNEVYDKIIAAARAAKGEQSDKGESDDTAALREKHRDMWGY